jgi:hypothetical protein
MMLGLGGMISTWLVLSLYPEPIGPGRTYVERASDKFSIVSDK